MSAFDRLDPEQQFQLRNINASWAMDGKRISDDAIDVLALYLLGEITETERNLFMRALH